MINGTRRRLLRAVGAVGAAGAAGILGSSAAGTGGHDTVRVPGDEATIQAGVDDASEGDLVLVEPGTYEEAVEVSTPGITVRGLDRNEVVLDGEDERDYGVRVTADGVALENMTARHYEVNAFYWTGVEGFRGSYLTASNNGDYGVYAYGARDGRFEHSYASGHPDAGFYLGRNQPYEAVVDDVVAEHNAHGYSGTSTGADLTITNSVWRYNMTGIVPNTLNGNEPPERATRIAGNEVYENGNESAPAKPLTSRTFGMGIVLWGGSDNVVEDNDVRDHENFGVVAAHNVVEPAGNVVRNNRVSGSGVADLALEAPAGDGNRFSGNEFATSLPESIEADASAGSEAVADVFADRLELAEDGEFPAGDWRDQPLPGDQPTMPDPEAAPRPVDKTTSWPAPVSQTSVADRDG
ncbi:right-handed parallel beta-helix repeat-containing protein [Halorarum salinum]|uniref:Right-handed parallel beta-helix repeat-containing protein n=1 Tax=Halorarum salinum TaxID=2743089 RepID=A0A7D5L9F2_9EURY|nr:right-handed parallel beta-helix repeat-containing protein [Halobaculum salinum]QLG61208.1 right-handed parallel beta-helix repeat-containing protein [Halobaculum salinum]